MASDLQDDQTSFLEIIGFRGSAKTTWVVVAFSIWVTISRRRRFIPIVSDTQLQAKLHLSNIKSEFEDNELLISDFGPFDVMELTNKKKDDEWNKTSIAIPRYGVRMVAISRGQSTRGLRKKENRPDLILIDDVENKDDVKSQDLRDDTYRWFKGEIMPLGERGKTKVVLVGNLMHADSLMSRIKKEIKSGTRKGVLREYPVVTEDGKILWPGKYPSMAVVEEEEREINDPIIWAREKMLKIVAEANQIIKQEHIKYYD